MKPITRAAIFMSDNLLDPVARMGTRPNGKVFYRTVGGILYELDETQIAVLDRFKYKIRMTPELAGTPPAPAENGLVRIAQLEAALAAEETRNEELLKRLDKAREGKDPDFCYDPDEWEFTSDWEDRDQVHGHGEALKPGEPMQVATLIRGPRKWVAEVPVTWTDDGDPDETEVRWFDTEGDALAAFIAPASEGDR